MKKCLICNKEIIKKATESVTYFKTKKYCSNKCSYNACATFAKGYIKSEEHRKNLSTALSGNKNGLKTGIRKTGSGYIIIYSPNHPFRPKSNYIRRSHLVMEKRLGRYLTKKEIVHHINEIKDDDRPENLQLFPNRSEHRKLHCLKKSKVFL